MLCLFTSSSSNSAQLIDPFFCEKLTHQCHCLFIYLLFHPFCLQPSALACLLSLLSLTLIYLIIVSVSGE